MVFPVTRAADDTSIGLGGRSAGFEQAVSMPVGQGLLVRCRGELVGSTGGSLNPRLLALVLNSATERCHSSGCAPNAV